MSETKSSVREWVVAILSAFAIAAIIRAFLFTPYEVHGASMEPTLRGNELLIVNQWIYKVKQPEYGDIIVFHYEDEGRDFIKRVIGLPGDVIEIRNGEILRNSKKINEPYIPSWMKNSYGENKPRMIVPKGHLYVLGDNRKNSKDSRVIGTVSMDEVVGRADVVLLPIKNMRMLTGE
jgi:signal peptidase I